ncbi:hypothetical protein ACIBUR_05770 [Streptomyces anulatus]
MDMGDPLEFVGVWNVGPDTRTTVEEPLVKPVLEVVVAAVADRVLDVIETMADGTALSSRCGTIGASNHR